MESVDVAALAAHTRESIELAARNARYNFFKTLGNVLIATAHTASDNAETVLLNMSRGCALKGLSGIPPVRDNIIRPLIFCTRAEIEQYCKENSLEYVTDSTNLSDDYTRNHIRHNVIPALKSVNTSFENCVTRMCCSLSDDSDFLTEETNKVFKSNFDGDKLHLPDDVHRAIKLRAINRLISLKTGKNADSLHLNEICDALPFDRKIVLFSGYYAHVHFFTVRIVDENVIKNFSVTERIVSAEEFKSLHKINKLLLNCAVDCDKISGERIIRTRQEGDSIKLYGRRVTKTLRKLYNECKVLPELRDKLPLAADERGVFWVANIGVDERVCVDKNTKNVLIFDCDVF